MPRLDQRSLTIGQLRQWAVAGRVFAVIDACDAPAVPARLRELGEDRAASLYRGRAEEELWGIGPWLAQADAETCDWISSDFFGPIRAFAVTDTATYGLQLLLRPADDPADGTTRPTVVRR